MGRVKPRSISSSLPKQMSFPPLRRLLTVLWEVLGEVATVNRKTLIFTNRLPSCRMVPRMCLLCRGEVGLWMGEKMKQ